jgi:hypothetical protein
MAQHHHLVLRSGAAGGASRRAIQSGHTAPAGACFETPRLRAALSMRVAPLDLSLDQ